MLAAAVEKSKAAAKLYCVEDYPELLEMKKAGTVAVTKSRTFEAAMRLHAEHPGAKVAVLNFQKKNGLSKKDGVAYAETQQAIYADTAIRADAPKATPTLRETGGRSAVGF